MRSIVTDIDTERPSDGEHYTIYFRQGELLGNMLLPQEAVETGQGYMEAAQAYLDAHVEENPHLADLPNLAEVGVVTKYLVEASLGSNSGMVFIGNDSEEIESFVTELHKSDNNIHTFADVLKSLEADCQRFPALQDCIEFRSPDEYRPGGEPLIHSYTIISGLFSYAPI